MDVLPEVETSNAGLNARFAQLAAWNGSLTNTGTSSAGFVKRLRKQRGWSQERVAHESGLNPSYVPKIERSEREPGVRTVSKLATALGVSAAELFEGIDGR